MALTGEQPKDDRSDISPVVVAEYGTYSEAQAALDRVTAAGMPHDAVSLVWSRLRQVEPADAAPRLAASAVEGALAGASAGGLAGILLSSFVELRGGVSVMVLVAVWTVAFGALGAAGRVVLAASGRDHHLPHGGELGAESYQLWVDEDVAARASAVLGSEAREPVRPRAQGRRAPARREKGQVHVTAATLLGTPAPGSAGGPPAEANGAGGAGSRPRPERSRPDTGPIPSA